MGGGLCSWDAQGGGVPISSGNPGSEVGPGLVSPGRAPHSVRSLLTFHTDVGSEDPGATIVSLVTPRSDYVHEANHQE